MYNGRRLAQYLLATRAATHSISVHAPCVYGQANLGVNCSSVTARKFSSSFCQSSFGHLYTLASVVHCKIYNLKKLPNKCRPLAKPLTVYQDMHLVRTTRATCRVIGVSFLRKKLNLNWFRNRFGPPHTFKSTARCKFYTFKAFVQYALNNRVCITAHALSVFGQSNFGNS